MAKAKPAGKRVIDTIGNLVAYSPIWQNGVAVPVLVEFDTAAQQHNFLNGTSVSIQYVDLDTGKRASGRGLSISQRRANRHSRFLFPSRRSTRTPPPEDDHHTEYCFTEQEVARSFTRTRLERTKSTAR